MSCNFYVRTHVNFARVTKIETMYGRSRVNVIVEPRALNLTFTRSLSYIVSISFMRVNFSCIRAYKLRDIGNQPLECDAVATLGRSHLIGLLSL